jgi:hypothetical protein
MLVLSSANLHVHVHVFYFLLDLCNSISDCFSGKISLPLNHFNGTQPDYMIYLINHEKLGLKRRALQGDYTRSDSLPLRSGPNVALKRSRVPERAYAVHTGA